MNGRVLAGLAAANLGLLFVGDETSPHALSVVREGSVIMAAPYASAVAAVVGLLAWQLAPRRSWSWLLVAGALGALPRAVERLDPELLNLSRPVEGWIFGCAAMFTLIGVLGAATLGWQAGCRRSAAALVGAAATLPLLPTVVWFTAGPGYSEDVLPSLTAVVTGVALLAAVVAVFLRDLPDCPRPAWRVALAGCAAATAPLVVVVWEPISTSGILADAVLYRAIALASLGLVAGAVAGWRVLLAAVAVGLPLGIFGLSFLFVGRTLFDSPVLATLVLVAGTVAGVLLALTPWRTMIGVAALILVTAGLVVVFFQVELGGPIATSTETMTAWMAPALLALALVAAATAAGSAGAAVADRSATPAALAGLAIPFTLLVYALITRQWDREAEIRLQAPEILLLLAAGLVVSTLALLGLAWPGLHGATRRPTAAPEPEAERDEPSVEPADAR